MRREIASGLLLGLILAVIGFLSYRALERILRHLRAALGTRRFDSRGVARGNRALGRVVWVNAAVCDQTLSASTPRLRLRRLSRHWSM